MNTDYIEYIEIVENSKVKIITKSGIIFYTTTRLFPGCCRLEDLIGLPIKNINIIEDYAADTAIELKAEDSK